MGQIGGFHGTERAGDDTQKKGKENAVGVQNFAVCCEVDKTEEQSAGQKHEGEIELNLRGEEHEKCKDSPLCRGKPKCASQTIGEEGEQNKPQSPVGHLDILDGKSNENQGLDEVVATDAGDDAALAEGVCSMVVELKHFDRSAKIIVVVVGGLILARMHSCAKSDGEDQGYGKQEKHNSGRGWRGRRWCGEWFSPVFQTR